MKLVVQHRNGTQASLAEAIEHSCTYEVTTSSDDDECDKLRRQIGSLAETVGKLVEFIVTGDQSDAAKMALLGEVLSYKMTPQRVVDPETI